MGSSHGTLPGEPQHLVPSSDVDQLLAVLWLRFPWLPSGGISSFRVVGWLHNAGTQQAPWVWEWETLHFFIRNAQGGLDFLVLPKMRGGTCMVAGTCHPTFERLRKKDG